MKLLSIIGLRPAHSCIVAALLLVTSLFVAETRAQSVEVSIPVVEGSVGQEVTIPIEVGDLTGKGVVAFSIRIGYDRAVLNDNFSYSLQGTLGEGDGGFATAVQGDGTFTIAYARNAVYPIAGSGTLINLKTTVAAEGTIPIDFLYLSLEQPDGTDVETTMKAGTFTTVGTATSAETGELPERFTVSGNYPNPFNPSTEIGFNLPERADVAVRLFDMLGREVMSRSFGAFAAGSDRTVRVEAGDLPSGAYIYRVQADMASSTEIVTGVMTLMK